MLKRSHERRESYLEDALASFTPVAMFAIFRRRLALPTQVATWSLTSLQQRLVKTGGRLVKHARYYWLLLAESHLTRRLFAGMLGKIAALPVPAG